MRSVTNQDKAIFRPARKRLHIVENPDFDVLAGIRHDCLCAGGEAIEALYEAVTVARLIIAYGLLASPPVYPVYGGPIKTLTLDFCFDFVVWDERCNVHGGILSTWIHDDALVSL